MDDHAPAADDAARRTVVRALVDSARRQAHDSTRRDGPTRPLSATPPLLTLPGYEIADEIHRGGQGVVYRARQLSTGRTVAVKLLHQGPFAGPRDRARFDREIQILAQLNHPNIVSVLDSGTAAGNAWFVMDHIHGRPLDQWLADLPAQQHHPAAAPAARRRTAHAAIAATLSLFARVCEAVHAAHLRGVIHRDLKPNNILVDESGEPHILDLGLARMDTPGAAADALAVTTVGHFMGSLPWASPEQAAGATDRIDLRTDVYSLGVMLFHALTGRFPCTVTGNLRDALDHIINDPPPRPSAIRRDLDDELDTILLKCLAKEPARRYDSAGDLARDLRHYLADEPLDARRDSAWYVLRKTIRRYRLPLAVAALFLVVLAASTIVAVALSIRAERAADDARRAGIAATAAQQEAVDHLHASLIDQARAARRTDSAGHRFDALDALRRAAQIKPTLEIRNEAIAALALADVRPVRTLAAPGLGYFDPDFSACALVDQDATIRVIRLADETEILRIPPPVGGLGEMHHVALSGNRLVRLFDPPTGARRLELWSIPQGTRVLTLDDVPFRARFDISPDGRHLAAGRLDRAIHIYDLQTARELQRIPLDRDPSYLAWDPTGRRLALYHANFLDAEILDLDSTDRIPAFAGAEIAWSVAWHPDGRLLAGAADRTIVLWDAAARRQLAVLTEHEDKIVHLTFSHDGKRLLSHSWDGYSVLWDVGTRRPPLRFIMSRPVFSPDARLIAGGLELNRGPVTRLLDLHDDGPRHRLLADHIVDAFVNAAGAFHPATGLLLAIDADPDASHAALRVFHPRTRDELASTSFPGSGSLALDPAGRFLLLAQPTGLLQLPVHAAPGRFKLGPPIPFGDCRADRVFLSADARRVLAADYDTGRLTLIDLPSDARRTVDCGQRAADARLSPDGRFVAVGLWYSSRAEVFDAESGRRLAELPLVGNSSVQFTPDSRALLTSDDRNLIVWDTATWTESRRAPRPGVLLCISPDGRTLVATPDLARIRLIDYPTLDEFATLESPESYRTQSCAFSPDGALLAQFTNRAGVVHLWDLRRLRADLADLGLDWNAPPYPPAEPAPDQSPPIVVTIDPIPPE